MRSHPLPFQIYRHFKGNLYQIIAVAQDVETGHLNVIYQALYSPFGIWSRNLDVFMGPVDHEKYPECKQEFRFELVQMPDRADKIQDPVSDAVSDANIKEDLELSSEEDYDDVVLDPLVLEFLESDTYEEKLNILAALHHRIDDTMLNTMSIAMDIELSEKDTESRFDELKNCVLTFRKYEGSRLR
ncbi:MAG: DUF1653 domain-containing protein [Lachnospiraceae bacterium]|nr:DUF1653 domain-containing protein [Lachnospiraceae bacterium]MDD3659569.1 DUF1653 domain-containing protein [Lachnospiraceae bacterium]